MSIIEVSRGSSAIVLGVPHTGTIVPEAIKDDLNQLGQTLADTDWHIDILYAGLLPEASMVKTTIHRYVIDPNRNPAGQSLYPGANTTSLCPTTDFNGSPIYKPGKEPRMSEIARRVSAYHQPYHEALQAELDRVKNAHGFAILFDCHSIRSSIPFLFEGTLPDFNIGTYSGQSCHPQLEQLVVENCRAASGYTSVLNGRFKGGWSTRHYGLPRRAQHAIQMELVQATYMQQQHPWKYDEALAAGVRVHLKQMLQQLSHWSGG